MRFLLLLFTLIAVHPLNAAAGDIRNMPVACLLAPGCTHLYEGDTAKGAAFAGSELALLGLGASVDNRLNQKPKEEWNIPYLLAGQVYVIDKWAYFQKEMLRLERKYPNASLMPFDRTPLKDLMLAPFRSENIRSPFVLAFMALGAADGILGYNRYEKKYGDINRVRAAGHTMNRDTGTLYYGTASAGISWGAGVSEEMLFRGMLMPFLDYKYGKKTGLAASSVAFGLVHLGNPGVSNPAYLVTQAALAGAIFGWQVQNDDYRLSRAIAAHFWYNMASLTATWLSNPRENPIGIGVTFRY